MFLLEELIDLKHGVLNFCLNKNVKGFNGKSYLYICVQLTMSNLGLCIINM